MNYKARSKMTLKGAKTAVKAVGGMTKTIGKRLMGSTVKDHFPKKKRK